MKHGFVITNIKCSGCHNPLQRNGHLIGDLDRFSALKEDLVTLAVALHKTRRGKCYGGKLRIEFANAIVVDVEKRN